METGLWRDVLHPNCSLDWELSEPHLAAQSQIALGHEIEIHLRVTIGFCIKGRLAERKNHIFRLEQVAVFMVSDVPEELSQFCCLKLQRDKNMKNILVTMIIALLPAGLANAQHNNPRVNALRLAELRLSDRFVSFVTGHLTNENQNILDPKNFPLVVADHCGVTVVDSLTAGSHSGFLYQIGQGDGRRRMIFTVSDLSNGMIDLGSRRISDPSGLESEFCKKSSDKRIIDEKNLKPSTCHVFYQYDDEAKVFRGSTPPEGCPSTFQGSVAMHVKEVVSDGRLEIEERWLDASGKQVAGATAGPYIYIRKPQFKEDSEARYSCWASLKNPDGTHTWDRANVTDRGGKFSTSNIVSAEGESLAYDVKLARVSFDDKVPVLKLSIHKSGNDGSILYHWAQTGAERIGINVTWIQVGCTRTE